VADSGVADVTVLVFGPLRERIGISELAVSGSTVRDVWDALVRRYPSAGATQGLRAARNLSYCDWDAALSNGDTVAFLPPVAGGSGSGTATEAVRVAITEDPIDVAALTDDIASSGDGGVVVFVGRVRDHNEGHRVSRIDYEAYPEMAERAMYAIAQSIRDRGDITAMRIVHRAGTLLVGEASIVVAVAAPHRRAAFRACQDAIDLIKRDVPIWKREHSDDGARWVGPGSELSHLDAEGGARMVDVSGKPSTLRSATARGRVACLAETLRLIADGAVAKGDVLSTARLAGIMAAKRTAELIPLCHPLALRHVDVDMRCDTATGAVLIEATARAEGPTGVEMEALTAVAVAGLTVIDMIKSIDRWASLTEVALVRKEGGKSGLLQRP